MFATEIKYVFGPLLTVLSHIYGCGHFRSCGIDGNHTI